MILIKKVLYWCQFRDKCFPVKTARRFLGLWMEERPPIWGVVGNILNKQSRIAERDDPPACELGEVLSPPHRINVSCYEIFIQKASDLD